jgi:hypothetical protein
MKPWLAWMGGASLAAAAAAGTFSYLRGQQDRAMQDSAALQRLDNDVQAAATLRTLKANARSGLITIRNVILIDAAQESTALAIIFRPAWWTCMFIPRGLHNMC